MFLFEPGVASLVCEQIKAEVDAVSASEYENRFSTRISPSNIGDECAAANWYAWRWVRKPEPKDGRSARYLNRGTKEEERVIELLRAAGWTIEERDPTTGEQFAVTALNGHMYGKIDGRASHPVHTRGIKVLFENKFVNYKRYSVLINKEKPISVVDPKYYTQICIYMKYMDLPATMFVVGNRNDDDINFAFFERNDAIADEAMLKGETIAFSKVRPARIAESAAFWKCKGCEFKEICHNGAPVELNCRSCLHCVPIPGGKFHCERWNATIPSKAAILAGCPEHRRVS